MTRFCGKSEFSKSNREMVRFLFLFPFLCKSHISRSLSAATAAYFHGGLYYRQTATASIGLGRCSWGQRLEGPRAHWVALGRSKGQWVAPERTQVAQGNVQEEQGRRTKGVLACASKDAKSSTSNHSNSSSHYLNQQPT